MPPTKQPIAPLPTMANAAKAASRVGSVARGRPEIT
jgi:hypothetical protein